MKQFDQLGLAEPLLRAISAEGYTNPTPIQAEVIPAMLEGRDVIGVAQTGTGKTASFVLPLLHRLGDHVGRPQGRSCGALILTPTRELAAQIATNINTYSRFRRVSVAVVVGGARSGPQIRALNAGVDIVVATPGRLMDHMSSGVIRLDKTTVVVLDEADQMMDLGFLPAIRDILSTLPKVRQTVLMSATMPRQIRALARDFQTNPLEIAIASNSRTLDTISQSVIRTDNHSKRRLLTEILSGEDVTRAIVFTRTKRNADNVQMHLQNAEISSAAMHGDLSQGQREKALGAFRSGRTRVLVATDVAARGIDVTDVSHVINFELPDVAEAYVHRIGRTARAGRTGTAISLVGPDERMLLRNIERLIGASIIAHPASIETRPASAVQHAPRVAATAPSAGTEPKRRDREHFHGGKPDHANGDPARHRQGQPPKKRRRPQAHFSAGKSA